MGEERLVVPVECKMKPLYKSTKECDAKSGRLTSGRTVGYCDDKNRPSQGISTEDIKKGMIVDGVKLYGYVG